MELVRTWSFPQTTYRYHIFLIWMFALLPGRAEAWGNAGHAIVAGLAETYLQAHAPHALAKANELVNGKSLRERFESVI